MIIKSKVLKLKLCMSSFMKLERNFKWTRMFLDLQCFINKFILRVPKILYTLSSYNSFLYKKNFVRKDVQLVPSLILFLICVSICRYGSRVDHILSQNVVTFRMIFFLSDAPWGWHKFANVSDTLLIESNTIILFD